MGAAIAALTACEATANGPCNSSIVAGGTYTVDVIAREPQPFGTSCGDSLDLTVGSSFLVNARDEYPVGNECYGRYGEVSALPGVIFDGPASGAAEGHWFRIEEVARIGDACEGSWLAVIDGNWMEPLPARGTLLRTFLPTSKPDTCGLSTPSCDDYYDVEVTPR